MLGNKVIKGIIAIVEGNPVKVEGRGGHGASYDELRELWLYFQRSMDEMDSMTRFGNTLLQDIKRI